MSCLTFSRTTSGTANTRTRLFARQLTVSVTSGQNTVTGTGFSLDILSSGDVIFVGSERKRIITIDSATQFTVDSPWSSTQASISAEIIPAAATGPNRFVAYVLTDPANTNSIFFGKSRNNSRDGADISATNRSVKQDKGLPSMPIIDNEGADFFVLSPSANQNYSIQINEL